MVTYHRGPILDIAMPARMYNTICLLTATMTILWLIRALRKFINVMKLREALNSCRVVQVRGIGSYLSYFEDAVPAHAKYIVHTRQVEPPAKIRTTYHPFTVHSVQMSMANAPSRSALGPAASRGVRQAQASLTFSVDITTTTPCKVMMLTEFKTDAFKWKVDKGMLNVTDDFARTKLYTQAKWANQLVQEASTADPFGYIDNGNILTHNDICATCSEMIELPVGTHKIKLRARNAFNLQQFRRASANASAVGGAATAASDGAGGKSAAALPLGNIDEAGTLTGNGNLTPAAPTIAGEAPAASPAPSKVGNVTYGLIVIPLEPVPVSLTPSSTAAAAAAGVGVGVGVGMGATRGASRDLELGGGVGGAIPILPFSSIDNRHNSSGNGGRNGDREDWGQNAKGGWFSSWRGNASPSSSSSFDRDEARRLGMGVTSVGLAPPTVSPSYEGAEDIYPQNSSNSSSSNQIEMHANENLQPTVVRARSNSAGVGRDRSSSNSKSGGTRVSPSYVRYSPAACSVKSSSLFPLGLASPTAGETGTTGTGNVGAVCLAKGGGTDIAALAASRQVGAPATALDNLCIEQDYGVLSMTVPVSYFEKSADNAAGSKSSSSSSGSKDASNSSAKDSTSADASAAAASITLQPSEIVFGVNGTDVYTAVEIFGLATNGDESKTFYQNTVMSSVESVRATKPAEKKAAVGLDDECVICLSEPKGIFLLPCRHLCVCKGCLVHIDKCPVCRASFEEYINLDRDVAKQAVMHTPAASVASVLTGDSRGETLEE